ncbi:hypothetical protein QWZ08_15520 [Ferruginibacter paludis]|uniref:hypothetical protein n=1 Tax=Ferruginibacter paludis TaxID=1310417 RepID=UPI0025B47DF4|nr:hypothetical protein [Ferruginibacter paludis]MDN3657058.1 hypothetical protein [Ferruginibacter paludis]
MSIYQIIEKLNNFIPFSEDNAANSNEIPLDDILSDLEKEKDFELAFDPIFNLLEKYPTTDFGSPGPIVHTIEKFIGYYESHLFESLNRKPTPLTILMLNRIINGEKNIIIKQNLIDRLQAYLDHPSINTQTAEVIKGFVDYQNKR